MASINTIKIGNTLYDVKSVHYGTSSTAAGTTAKAVTVSNGNFTLETGARISVKFTNANTATAPTLNVASSGAKTIRVQGKVFSTEYSWSAGEIVEFVYDGSYWNIVNSSILVW